MSTSGSLKSSRHRNDGRVGMSGDQRQARQEGERVNERLIAQNYDRQVGLEKIGGTSIG